MAAVSRVLVVGGGIAGMSAAIMLRRAGVEVDLAEQDPQWRVYGAGISITGPTLRAFDALGVLDPVLRLGAPSDGYTVFSMAGERRDFIETPRLDGGRIPGAGGIMRPVLHEILSRRTLELGAKVRLGIGVSALKDESDAAIVRFTDGVSGRYDLVIGADGIASQMRRLVSPDAPEPAYTGQSCWRLLFERPPGVEGRQFYLGGPVKVGLNPVSRTHAYLFVLQPGRRPEILSQPDLVAGLAELLQGYGGVVAHVRKGLKADAQIVLRPVDAVLAPHPWHRGRMVLVGDAAHATTPQLSSGAGMAVEDALVLAQELQAVDDLPTALRRYMDRRYERCRLVVENSLEIGRLERSGAPPEAQSAVVEQSLAALARPF